MSSHSSDIQQYHLHQGDPGQLQFEIYPLSDYLAEGGCHTLVPHTHTFYQIIWFMSGTGKHYVDFNQFDVIPNTLFFISKGQVHHFDDSLCDGCIIHFNESFLAGDENYVNIFLKHNIFDSFEKEPLFHIASGNSQELQTIVNRMQGEIRTPNSFAHREYLKLLLNLFLIGIQRFGMRKDCNTLSANNPVHALFVRFRQLLEANYTTLHTVNEYADRLSVSAKTLTNCTREISHQTPLAVITDRITLEARRLLAYTDRNVNEIAYGLGFDDPSYFVKFFKRQTGLSPVAFRKAVS